MEGNGEKKLKYIMSTFIPIKKILVVTRMFFNERGKTDVLKATEEGTPIKGESPLKTVGHTSMQEIQDLKRIHGKVVLHFFSEEFFKRVNDKGEGGKGDIFFKLQILIKQFGLFFSVTKEYGKEYATAEFFTQEFTLGKPETTVTNIKRLKAESYSEILRESFNLLRIINNTIQSVERKILPVKQDILQEFEKKLNDRIDEITQEIEQKFERLRNRIVKKFIEV